MKTIVHIQYGGDLEGQPPFIPGEPEVEVERKKWQDALGDDYLVIATNQFVTASFFDVVEE